MNMFTVMTLSGILTFLLFYLLNGIKAKGLLLIKKIFTKQLDAAEKFDNSKDLLESMLKMGYAFFKSNALVIINNWQEKKDYFATNLKYEFAEYGSVIVLKNSIFLIDAINCNDTLVITKNNEYGEEINAKDGFCKIKENIARPFLASLKLKNELKKNGLSTIQNEGVGIFHIIIIGKDVTVCDKTPNGSRMLTPLNATNITNNDINDFACRIVYSEQEALRLMDSINSYCKSKEKGYNKTEIIKFINQIHDKEGYKEKGIIRKSNIWTNDN